VPERTDLVRGLRREVATTKLAALLGDPVPQRGIERLQQRDPGSLAAGDLVELLLHAGGELEIDVVPEMLHEQIGHDRRDRFGA